MDRINAVSYAERDNIVVTVVDCRADAKEPLWAEDLLDAYESSARPSPWNSDMSAAPRDAGIVDLCVQWTWMGEIDVYRAPGARWDDASKEFNWPGKRPNDKPIAWMIVPPLPQPPEEQE